MRLRVIREYGRRGPGSTAARTAGRTPATQRHAEGRSGVDDDPMKPEQARTLARLRTAWGRMDGRAVLVTGATRGIGLETWAELERVCGPLHV